VIRQLILDADLVTILPLIVVQREIEAGLFHVLPFDDEIVFPLHVVRRQIRHPSAARDYVIGEIKRLFADLAARQAARR
jgi:DNA-binding transcriptional LysR family regulator